MAKLKNSIIRSCVQNFKVTDESQITILRSTKISRQYEHAFFLKKKTKKQKVGPSVCKCVPHTPKLILHIVPNMCITWKDITWEMDETVWNRFDLKHSPQT